MGFSGLRRLFLFSLGALPISLLGFFDLGALKGVALDVRPLPARRGYSSAENWPSPPRAARIRWQQCSAASYKELRCSMSDLRVG